MRSCDTYVVLCKCLYRKKVDTYIPYHFKVKLAQRMKVDNLWHPKVANQSLNIGWNNLVEIVCGFPDRWLARKQVKWPKTASLF